MPAEITQENVRLLIPGKAAKVAGLIMEARRLSPKDALLKFYRSSTYRKLEQESTKTWHYSPEQLFTLSAFSRREDAGPKHGPGRSVLTRYADEIISAWNNRKSARDIVDAIARKGVRTTPQNVWKFIQRHKQQRNAECAPADRMLTQNE